MPIGASSRSVQPRSLDPEAGGGGCLGSSGKPGVGDGDPAKARADTGDDAGGEKVRRYSK